MRSELCRPSKRRWRPVRLVDVPLDVRMRAAQAAAGRETEAAMKQAILAAALYPSDNVYFVAA